MYGIREIADELGVSRELISQWYRRGKLPPPTAVLAATPVWTGRRIERWLEEQKQGTGNG